MQDRRIFRDINISNPAPSPDGSKLVGVSSSYTQGYYYAMMNIVLYELSVGR